jgi:FlaG/FlaF family flagellin (archaellin)
MLKLNLQKEGVSPLIATVLLVALSVALGAVVMNFSSDATYDLTQRAGNQIEREVRCSIDVSLKIVEIGGEKFLCYNRSETKNFEVIVENQGRVDVEGIQVFLLDNNNNPHTLYNYTGISAHGRIKYVVSLENLVPEFAFPPVKAVISPVLSRQGAVVEVCTNNRIEIEDIERCSD